MASASTWTHTLDTPANRAFVDSFRRATGGRPDAFSMLGYETAMLMEKGMEKGRNLKREELAAALAEATFTGPRGAMLIDATTGALTSPLYLHSIRRGMGSLSNDVVGQLDNAASSLTAVRSGWLSPYLVV
jgi:branched-chain amino acid transport system substrate-binding protein